MKILIVDDVKTNLISLRALLEDIDSSFVLIEANSGEEALEKVLINEIDLILLDVQMPTMDGFEVAELIKSNNQTKHISIIFLTAIFKAEEFINKGFALGAVDYLTKPIDENLFINRITLYSKLHNEVIKNRKKDQLMFQQAKMAALGDMISNISHQWRQPLSAISTTASGIILKKSIDNLTSNDLDKELENIIEITKYLSRIIDDFRTFFKKDAEKLEYTLPTLLNKSISLVKVLYDNAEIKIIKNIQDDISLYIYENELIQILINLFTNASHALDDVIYEKLIFLDAYVDDSNMVIIKIKDNAGGIKNDILTKVFEPYFTTKHESQGTGLGLYIANEIITKHMSGKIEVENSSYIYNNIDCTGALFTLTLPFK